MAQNTWINVVADKSITNRPSHNSEVHTASGGTAAAGDFTISFDNTVIANLGTFDKVVAEARARAMAGGLK